jgi:hypothetical protein
MSNLLNFSNRKENAIIAEYKFNNCKFSSEKKTSCRCSHIKKYNFCESKRIKINNFSECFNCSLFQKK